MKDSHPLEESLRRVVRHFLDLNLSFHLTGGIVSWVYGEPRFTQDLDLVIRLEEEDVERVSASLSREFLVDTDEIANAVRRRGIFQALDKDTLIKIDCYVGEAIPGELDRTTWLKIVGDDDFPIVSKEDSILSKLLWIQKGSHKSRADIVGMLLAPEPFDMDFVQSMANELGVASLFDELRGEAQRETEK